MTKVTHYVHCTISVRVTHEDPDEAIRLARAACSRALAGADCEEGSEHYSLSATEPEIWKSDPEESK